MGPGTFDGVIVVGGTCNVSTAGTTKVEGDLKVESGGALSAIMNAGGELIVAGNVQCDFCDSVFLGAFAGGVVEVKGDVQVKGASDASGINGVSVHGNVQFEEMTEYPIALGSTIDGDLQVFKNFSAVSGPKIGSNTIDGNLQCNGPCQRL